MTGRLAFSETLHNLRVHSALGKSSVLYAAVQEHAEKTPNAMAMAQGDLSWTWHAWHRHIQRLMLGLQEAGIQSNDHVAVMLNNQWEFLAMVIAVRAVGAVVVPINLLWAPADLMYVVQHSTPTLFVTNLMLGQQLPALPMPVAFVDATAEHMEDVEADAEIETESEWDRPFPLISFDTELLPQVTHSIEPAESDADSLALLLYTSGTTGRPKGVMLSEKNIWANVMGIAETAMFQPEDRLLVALPLFHCYGLTLSLTAMTLGLMTVLEPTFRPKGLIHSLVQHHITVLPLVPTLFQVLAETLAKGAVDLSSLRLCVSGGASLPPSVIHQFKDEWQLPILEGYGMTEAAPVVSVNRLDEGPLPGSVGLALCNVTLDIDPQTNEVLVFGENVMLGYYQDPEATAEAMTKEGWLKTGDLGHLDEAGHLFLTGRAKDLMIKAGENISPTAIEHVLITCDEVKEVCVFGQPHPKLGECIVAAVVPTQPEQWNEVNFKQWCRGALSSFQVPDKVVVFDELPKNGAGKILRRQLQQTVLERESEAEKTSPVA